MDLCAVPRIAPEDFPEPADDLGAGAEGIAVLAGGCFWCVDAVYRQLEGVVQVTAGYAGGTAETADYRTVCSGTTGHAEVVMIRFDPSRITFGQILKVFFSVAHDPTQLNRQGNDFGPQYRSAIFVTDANQRRVAQAYIDQLEAAKVYDDKIVTTLEPLEAFYEAEAYHQDYAAQNPEQPYIAHISMPKVAKVRKHFADRLKAR
ncbi:MAG: peptide-methionine (S)-S-oxide reductase MsrA [Alphaproteobacteria bacterium]